MQIPGSHPRNSDSVELDGIKEPLFLTSIPDNGETGGPQAKLWKPLGCLESGEIPSLLVFPRLLQRVAGYQLQYVPASNPWSQTRVSWPRMEQNPTGKPDAKPAKSTWGIRDRRIHKIPIWLPNSA